MEFLSEIDIERIIKAADSAEFLSNDIADIIKSDNPLVRELFIELYEDAILIEKKVKRLASLAGMEF